MDVVLFLIFLCVVVFGATCYFKQGKNERERERVPMAIVAPPDPDQPLPPETLPENWHAVLDKLGRTYYQNSETKETQWHKPRKFSERPRQR